jgi:enoyl-CoA hydratase/carnithine racemase
MTYQSIEVSYGDGVTELRLHSDGGPLIWNKSVHHDLGYALAEVAGDRNTKVVIIAGTGDTFCVEMANAELVAKVEAEGWEPVWWEGKRIVQGIMDLDVPVIGVVNGPAFIHAEIPLLADIVIASDTAVLADHAHFTSSFVPGDGVHLIWPYLLGPRRAKYFLLTGQEIGAVEARDLGLVNEIHSGNDAMARARELASGLAEKPLPLLRYTREALNIVERRQISDGLSHGLALEGVGYAAAVAEIAARENPGSAAG